jgi:hypothetical protein
VEAPKRYVVHLEHYLYKYVLLTSRGIQFAIRPAIRNNSKFNRDSVIKTVASVVGPEHSVDLKNYDFVILIDVIKVCFTLNLPFAYSIVSRWLTLVSRM